jgi:hypothetical protein
MGHAREVYSKGKLSNGDRSCRYQAVAGGSVTIGCFCAPLSIGRTALAVTSNVSDPELLGTTVPRANCTTMPIVYA